MLLQLLSKCLFNASTFLWPTLPFWRASVVIGSGCFGGAFGDSLSAAIFLRLQNNNFYVFERVLNKTLYYFWLSLWCKEVKS